VRSYSCELPPIAKLAPLVEVDPEYTVLSTWVKLSCTHRDTAELPPLGPPPPPSKMKRTCLLAIMACSFSTVIAGSVPEKPPIASTGLPVCKAMEDAWFALDTATR